MTLQTEIEPTAARVSAMQAASKGWRPSPSQAALYKLLLRAGLVYWNHDTKEMYPTDLGFIWLDANAS